MTQVEINNLVKEKLTEYLGFDSSLLFRYVDFLVVFGGAIRDIIADKSIENITDVDILCLSQSRNKIISTIIEQGYKYVDLQRPELHSMYKEIRHIFEPKTFMKGDKVIQFITPCQSGNVDYGNAHNHKQYEEKIKNTFYHLLKNVDLISSGVFYDGYQVYESVVGSIPYILKKKSFALESNVMYDRNRVASRAYKLQNKGFNIINEWGNEAKIINRYLKLKKLNIENNKYPTIHDFVDNVEPKFDLRKLI